MALGVCVLYALCLSAILATVRLRTVITTECDVMDVVAFMVYIFRHAVIVLYTPFSLHVSSAIQFNFYRIA